MPTAAIEAETLLEILAALGAMILATTTPFPAELAALGVAMAHGFWLGLVLIWTGAMAGAILSYALADRLADHARWLTESAAVGRAKRRLHGLGWRGVLGLRLIPLVPFFALSLAAGLLRLPPRAYLVGTALGILPASAIIAALGQGLISARLGQAAIAALALAALVALAWTLRRRRG